MYVDAILDRKSDIIHIAERRDGKRVLVDVPVDYVFYHEDASGTHRSIFGHPCKRFLTHASHKFHIALTEKRDAGKRIFESDVNAVYRKLATNYMGADTPVLNLGFFDIEADFDQTRGFAPANDPFNAITAISLYRSADQRLLSYVLRPPTVSPIEAQDSITGFADTFLFDDEKLLLLAFLDAIEDVDLLSGWNSSSYDVPYLVNRCKHIIGNRAARRFCLWDQAPVPRQYKNKFQKLVDTYDFVGRVHIDYLDLYAKHTPKQHLSYRLDAIAAEEIDKTKVSYTGTLDDLYHKEFAKFIDYNRQDVMLMVEIDQKLRFIELANQIAHANCVLLKTTMGSVALVEQAIINEMHAMGYVVPDRRAKDEPNDIDDLDDDDDVEEESSIEDSHSPVVGAYVAQPKTGLHDHIGCVDINSLYPSAIRALNMSPETMVGQVRLDETMRLVNERVAKLSKTQRAEAWDSVFCTCEIQHMHDRDDAVLTVDFFDHLHDTVSVVEMTGKQLHEFVFDASNAVCITANGTIFRTDVEGMIPALLAKWYSERKDMQAKQKIYEDIARNENDKEALYLASFWNQRQQARKILLNSAYGAMLNEGFRMYDQRLGQSVTLTGRSIVRHMNAKINEVITGSYDYKGDAIQYSDTDSSYFSISNTWRNNPDFSDFDWSRDNIINLYDLIAEEANQTFPDFMQTTFNTSSQRGGIIRAGRELVASKALFIKKKKYAVLVIDKEGKRQDIDGKMGELKVMGLDLKRADTPKVVQQFLGKLLMDLLTDIALQQMFDDIKAFRQTFKNQPGWEKGTPKKVANLAAFANKFDAANGKGLLLDSKVRRDESLRVLMPGHVRASLNWNRLCDLQGDYHATRITDSSRIIVCKLRSNTMGMTSIAYPIDELLHLPQWFKELPFDDEAMEETIIDNKIQNLCGVLNWDLTETKERMGEQFFAWDKTD